MRRICLRVIQYLSSVIKNLESIGAVIHLIREDIFQRKNLFNGSLSSKNQDQSLSPFLLVLGSMLINGEVNVEEKCSQAVMTLSGMVTCNTPNLKKSTHALHHHHHKRKHKIPVTIYAGLK